MKPRIGSEIGRYLKMLRYPGSPHPRSACPEVTTNIPLSAPIWVKLACSLATKGLAPTKCPLPTKEIMI